MNAAAAIAGTLPGVKCATDPAWALFKSAELVCPAAEVTAALERLAAEITRAVGHLRPLVLGVMRGSVVFAGHLLPLLRFPLEFDYLEVTRYDRTTRGSAIQWKVGPGTTVAGRVVLLLDDILDEGHTLAEIRERMLKAGAQQFLSAVFADKDIGREKPATADFVGVRLPNRYVFGFGMDVHGWWRNLPAIYALPEHE